MPSLSPRASRVLASQRKELSRHWPVVAETIAAKPYLVFVIWSKGKSNLDAISRGLSETGFEISDMHVARRWFRRGWDFAAWRRVKAHAGLDDERSMLEIAILLEVVITKADEHGGRIIGWGFNETRPDGKQGENVR